jgi:hypothetical protein
MRPCKSLRIKRPGPFTARDKVGDKDSNLKL